MSNLLYYGDNLDVLKQYVADESVDLVYLDPPFNSNRSYNVLFGEHRTTADQAQIHAFGDTWTWTPQTEITYNELREGGAPSAVGDALEGFHRLIGEGDLLAYLVMMAPRLVQLRAAMKDSASLYLHCDPTASHYLKILADAVFGAKNFRNEIIWRRTGAHAPRKSFGPIHDTLLFYTKSADYYFRIIRSPYTKQHVASRYTPDSTGKLKFTSGGNVLTGPGSGGGESSEPWKGFDPRLKNRHWAVPGFLSEVMPPEFQGLSVLAKLDALYDAGLIDIIPGAAWPTPVRYLKPDDGYPVGDIWAYQPGTERVLHDTLQGIDEDVAWLGPTDPERLGYQTQKPEGLLERIISASCPDDGLVLDPFCGCGTAVVAAQRLGRRWVGIDVTYIAVDLMRNRLVHTFEGAAEFEIDGIPQDMGGARALFERNPLDFERWAVSLVDGQPNETKNGGKDGIVHFHLETRAERGEALVSVKGGRQVLPAYVNELLGAVERRKSEMGILITLTPPTRGMVNTANQAGNYIWPIGNRPYPRIQIMTIEELLSGKHPDMPPPLPPYIKARRQAPPSQQLVMGNAVEPEPPNEGWILPPRHQED